MQTAPDILLIKTSSMGDVLHNLPVATDIGKHLPGASITWVVEESFSTLPSLHPGVHHTISVAIRRWRKTWWASRLEMQVTRRRLNERHYDLVLDTQGLIKSGLIALQTRGLRCGYDWKSAREPLASCCYNRTFTVPKDLHAVERNRLLAGLALGYTPSGPADYGIRPPAQELPWLDRSSPYAVLLHATSRDDKLWDEDNWITLGQQLANDGLQLILPWGSPKEQIRSKRLASRIPNAICPPGLNLTEAATLLGQSHAVFGVDTGLTHLAAALATPTIGIYTATEPGLTGLYAGARAINLGGIQRPPSVDEVLATLNDLLQHD